MKTRTFAIIGGGAAGVFAAIQCKRISPSTRLLLFEKTNQWLSKVRISGGGRCNVTHHCFDPPALTKRYPRGTKELLGPFHTFQPKDTIAWFEKEGIKLKTEEDGRMFPTTDSSETIIDCLLGAASLAGVEMKKQHPVQSIKKTASGFSIHCSNEEIAVDKVLLATGSSPWGHKIAKELGHEIIEPVPSLFTFNTPTSPLLSLSGLSVPDVKISLREVPLQERGPLLLTHWGFSGPAALKLSAWAARELHRLQYKATLVINWTAADSPQELYENFLAQKEKTPRALPDLSLPKNLSLKLLSNESIDPAAPIGTLSHKTLLSLAQKLYADPYQVDGKTLYKQEFVTAGGVDLKEIHWKTMESRIIPGLFFAGEILNVDGVTGGFNFQNAWTTAWLAANALANDL